MRDAIIKSVQKTWMDMVDKKGLPRFMASIFADDIVESISGLNKNKGVFESVGKTIKRDSCTKMLHRPCSCGSQFQIFTTEKKDEWLFICDNENTCCEVVSMRIKAKTPEDAWLIWDQTKTNLNSNKSWLERIGQAMKKIEQEVHEENIKPHPNCGPENIVGVVPPKGTKFYFQSVSPPVEVSPDAAWNDVRRMKRGIMVTEYTMKLKECAKALVDKLKLVNDSPEYKGMYSFMAAHGVYYTGPNYGKELKDLQEALEGLSLDRSCEKCGKLMRDVLPEVTACGDCDIQ